MCRIVDFGALHRFRRAVEIGSAVHMVLAKPNGKSFQRLLRCALRRNGWPSSELRRSLQIQLTTVKINFPLDTDASRFEGGPSRPLKPQSVCLRIRLITGTIRSADAATTFPAAPTRLPEILSLLSRRNRIVHDGLGFLQDAVQMIHSTEALPINFVDVLRARGTSSEPTALRHHFQPAN
jgi:hypothetical protein